MDIGGRSVGHAGGTCAPFVWVRQHREAGVWSSHAPDLVPQRAPRDVRTGSKTAKFRGSAPLRRTRGTAGHGRPAASTQVHGRA